MLRQFMMFLLVIAYKRMPVEMIGRADLWKADRDAGLPFPSNSGDGISPAPTRCTENYLFFNPIFDFSLVLVEARFRIGGARASNGSLHTNEFSRAPRDGPD